MKRTSTQRILYSESDLTNFVACQYLSFLDHLELEQPQRLTRAKPDEQTEMIQKKGEEHEQEYLQLLREQGYQVIDCSEGGKSLEERTAFTEAKMREGAAILYQACLHKGRFHAYSDFIIRIERPSALGDYSYEVLDTKLARSAQAHFIIQLCFLSDLLGQMQEKQPEFIHIVLGDKQKASYPLVDYFSYYLKVKEMFLESVHLLRQQPEAMYPQPCSHCMMCHWREHCKERWQADDHLSLVANIRKDHISKLRQAQITTMKQLAQLPPDQEIHKMNPTILRRLQRQASLQVRKRETGEDCYEFLLPENAALGFAALPPAQEGDLFYDIEGDPLIKEVDPHQEYDNLKGGLEYLHGVWQKNGPGREQGIFRAFWALEKGREEKKCFEELMDFFWEHLQQYPQAKIYHYAPYEVSALKRLMCEYGTREQIVDYLLRNEILVDLYKVVKHALLVSEPKYSIKNLETFYMDQREQDLKSGGASVVYFEEYLRTGDPKYKQEIEDYNRIDCVSTYLLREWLLEKKQEALPLLQSHSLFPIANSSSQEQPQSDSGSDSATSSNQRPKSEKVVETEKMVASYRDVLCRSLPDSQEDFTQLDHLRQLLFFLVDYYRREKKPEFWEMYSRFDKTPLELIEDGECLGAASLEKSYPPETYKRSLIHTYSFPLQETKLKVGSEVADAGTRDKLGRIHFLDMKNRLLQLKMSKDKNPPGYISLIPSGIISTEQLEKALQRVIDAAIEHFLPQRRTEVTDDDPYSAILDILLRQKPRFHQPRRDNKLIAHNSDQPEFLEHLNQLIEDLANSYLFIQGPPGTGKTYTASQVIVELLAKGKKVGVTSNSHKAINNLLAEVEKIALKREVSFAGRKKSSRDDKENHLQGELIEDVFSNAEVVRGGIPDLVAGTAWLFSRDELDQQLDYLFIDEAGQISLAQTISLASSARNLILLGDPMQLPQPSQGIHPEPSGLSVLEYLLQNKATIAEDRGVFLNTTWRMHGDICRFLSRQIYDNRLLFRPDNSRQKIIHNSYRHFFNHSGIAFLPVYHRDNSSSSPEETAKIQEIYRAMRQARFLDKKGQQQMIGQEDILVVAPYNLQVKMLQEALGEEARVGTIDKFQGQQAPITIISMTTSSGEDIPRNIDFLFSPNRLNVALSRAKSLAIVVACPELLKIKCRSVSQIALVNLLCALEKFCQQNSNKLSNVHNVQMTFF